MTTIYLHVGLHKTGTSAIQRALAGNSEWLLEHGYYYPAPDCLDAHHAIVQGLLHSAADPLLGEKRFVRMIKEWKKAAKDAGADVLISSEMFSEGLRWDVFNRICAANSIKIIIYLRRQDLMLESVYGQVLKQIGLVVDDLVKNPPYNLNYMAHLRRWCDAVGRENVIVETYGMDGPEEWLLLRNFMGLIGVRDLRGFVEIEGRINRSLGLVEAKVLERVYPFYHERFREAIPVVRERLAKILGDADRLIVGNYLTLQQRKEIMDKMSESNETIRRSFFPERSALFPELPLEGSGNMIDENVVVSAVRALLNS